MAGVDADHDLAVLARGHRRRAAGRVGARRRRAGHRLAGGRAGQPRRARPARHARLRRVRRAAASAARAGAASAAPSSTRRRCRAARRADRWWTPDGQAARHQQPAARRRPDPRGARRRRRQGARRSGSPGGEAPAPHRLGVAIAPPRVARRCAARSACRSATACWCARSRTAAPAAAAGIEPGDLIVARAASRAGGVDALYAALDAVPAAGGDARADPGPRHRRAHRDGRRSPAEQAA